MKYLSLIFCLFLLSCATPQQAFHKTVLLPETKVHVFGPSQPTGWAKRGEIMVSGKIVNGTVFMDKDVAWHELQHVMNIENPEFANPDKD